MSRFNVLQRTQPGSRGRRVSDASTAQEKAGGGSSPEAASENALFPRLPSRGRRLPGLEHPANVGAYVVSLLRTVTGATHAHLEK